MSDLATAIAVVFRRRGSPAMTPTDFRHVASFDLKWFPPKDSARLLEAALASGLLVDEAGRLRPSFDVQRVDVPVDFQPGPDVLDAPAGTLPAAPAATPPLAELLAAAVGVSPEELAGLARAEQERAQGMLEEETALLLAARRRGADVRPYLKPTG
ncbi:MAG TPA: DUF2240 family protein [Candidatus Thermoplasmatota archaeon]|nr:DUF2240 family protein [Candidatus Thermoplasmatota archaeon]